MLLEKLPSARVDRLTLIEFVKINNYQVKVLICLYNEHRDLLFRSRIIENLLNLSFSTSTELQ